mgnify:CR=1 FL=1
MPTNPFALRIAGAALALWALAGPSPAQTGEVRIAVAANFTEPAKEIAAGFEKATGHRTVLSFGATGQFYAQIVQGAPFEVLLSADRATPEKAVREGFAVAGTQYTYAVGKLVLFSKDSSLSLGEDFLKQGRFQKLAIANPAAAPYGAAAVETLQAMQLWSAMQPKIVQGQNIAQTFQFVDTGNAEIGFVALAQIAQIKEGSRWIVPPRYHSPILQDAVLLKPGEHKPAARAWLAYLKSEPARLLIERYGYGVGD